MIAYTTIGTADIEKAKAFYAATLGWSFDEMPMPEGTYYVAMLNDEPVGGLMTMPAEVPAGTPPHWLNYVEVKDIDKSIVQAQQAGATILKQPTDVPEVGRLAIIADPTGAVMGWITPTSHSDD